MFGILALEDHGLTPEKGTVLVTGAAGGVGSIAVAILSNLGYKVAGVTGRPESEAYLKSLGVSEIIPRDEVNEAIKRPVAIEVCIHVYSTVMVHQQNSSHICHVHPLKNTK